MALAIALSYRWWEWRVERSSARATNNNQLTQIPLLLLPTLYSTHSLNPHTPITKINRSPTTLSLTPSSVAVFDFDFPIEQVRFLSIACSSVLL
mgnify:CR=1 FL=1